MQIDNSLQCETEAEAGGWSRFLFEFKLVVVLSWIDGDELG